MGAGIGFGIVGARDQPARVAHGRLFYANLAGMGSSTDAMLQATPSGVEVGFVLRSATAPTDRSLQFHLPAGASLQPSTKVSGGRGPVSVIASDGSVLGFVAPPSAIDAAGQPVPSSYSISGADTLVMHIDDQSGSFVYPILADPLVAISAAGGISSAYKPQTGGGYGYQFGFFTKNGLSFTFGPANCPTYSYCNNSYGEYFFSSIAGAYIYEEAIGAITHNPASDYEIGGIFDYSINNWARGSWKDTVHGSGPGGSGPASGIAARGQTASESNIGSHMEEQLSSEQRSWLPPSWLSLGVGAAVCSGAPGISGCPRGFGVSLAARQPSLFP